MRKAFFYLGIFSPILFVILSGLAQRLTPNFNSIQSPASNLAAGQYGWLQNLAFIVGGVGFTLIGLSIFKNISKRTKVAPSLIVLFGVILILEAFFQSNPNQTDSATQIHIFLFMIGMVGMLISTFLLGNAIRSISSWMAWYCYLTGAVSAIGFIGIFATQGQTGLWQQVATGPLFLWLIIIDIYTFVNYKKR